MLQGTLQLANVAWLHGFMVNYTGSDAITRTFKKKKTPQVNNSKECSSKIR